MPRITIDGKEMQFPYTKAGKAKARELAEIKGKSESMKKMMREKGKVRDSEEE